MTNDNAINPAYVPLVEGCKAHGISRSVAFALAKSGMLEAFRIGSRRYVKTESLRTLPERLAQTISDGGAL